MTAVDGVLSRLNAVHRAPFGGALAVPLDPHDELRDLIKSVEQLERTGRQDVAPSHSVLADARSTWATSRGRIEQLSARQVRALCWDPETVADQRFTRAVQHHPDLSQNRRWIEGLLACYLARWRTMPEPHILEEVLRGAIGQFNGRSEQLERYRPIAREFFSQHAATCLATQLNAEQASISKFFEQWRLDRASGFGEAVANATVENWTDRFGADKQTLRGSAAMQRLRQLLDNLLTSDIVGPHATARSISALILWDQAEQDPAIQDALRSFLLDDRRFRDPRLPNRSSMWDLCSPEARQRVIGWLAKGDLLFFFEFVIQEDPHGRRPFWLRYIDRAIDAHVALSEDDEYRLRANVKEKLSYSRVVGGQATSAFLMRFRGTGPDILCIEFSKSGNALYVHDADAFVQRFGSIRRGAFELSADLKNKSTCLHRHSHIGYWQSTVQAFLARHGVRPS